MKTEEQRRKALIDDLEFYCEDTLKFLGKSNGINGSAYAILGVPFDFTSTYRPGSRFAPTAIREASANLEAYSPSSQINCTEINIVDLGNMVISHDVTKTIERLSKVSKIIENLNMTKITIGGEHTITKGCVSPQLSRKNGKLICIDAHLDLRNEYQDQSLGHATFMRRIAEQIRPEKILYIGTRAVTTEELEYLNLNGIKSLSTELFTKLPIATLQNLILNLIGDEPLYISLDMDVIDPSQAPAVGNPEPNGIDTRKLIEVLNQVCMRKKILGIDIVEVTPLYDKGSTALLAAKIITELISSMHLRNFL
jgi:agmatinase